MCDEIVINVCLFIYLSNISVFLDKSCINPVYTCIYTAKWKKYLYYCFIFLWRTLFFFCGAPLSVAHQAWVRHRIPLLCGLPSYFCGARPGCATESGFLWRMPMVRHRNNILVATILWRTQQFWGCATESIFGAPLIRLFLLVTQVRLMTLSKEAGRGVEGEWMLYTA